MVRYHYVDVLLSQKEGHFYAGCTQNLLNRLEQRVGCANFVFAHAEIWKDTVLERYEYDAYGNPTIWNADFTTERANSNYGNPYLFTGRRTDILDSGSLKIQYNRNRYYDYYTGRWLTHDPLSYRDSMNMYEYVISKPNISLDPYGLCWWCKDKCKKGEIDYEIVDTSIVPASCDPDLEGAITGSKAIDLDLELLTVAKTVGLLLMGLPPEDVLAELIAIGITEITTTAMISLVDDKFEELIELRKDKYDSYLWIQIKRCKKERCCLFWKRYNWKKDKKVKYYQCYDGSLAASGYYENPGDAAANQDDCKETFKNKFPDYSLADLNKNFLP